MVSIMHHAANASPMPILEAQRLVDRPACTTHLARREPSVNVVDDRPGLRGLVVEDADELGEPEVPDLLSPQPLHGLEVQVFKEQVVVPERQPSRELEVVVPALIGDTLVDAGERHPGLPTVVAPFLLGRELLAGPADGLASLVVEQRGDLLASIAEREKGLQTEVRARAFTRHDAVIRSILDLAGEEEIKVSQRVPLDGDGFHRPLDLAGLAEPENPFSDPDLVSTQQRPSGLLEREGTVLAAGPETGRRGLDPRLPVSKEERVCPVDPIGDILDGLTAQSIPVPEPGPLLEFGKMLLEAILVQTLAVQSVVPLVERNAVVPNARRHIDLPMQIAVLLGAVELVGKRLAHTMDSNIETAPYIPAMNDGALRRNW